MFLNIRKQLFISSMFPPITKIRHAFTRIVDVVGFVGRCVEAAIAEADSLTSFSDGTIGNFGAFSWFGTCS